MYERCINLCIRRGAVMGWKATGQPTVRRQRTKWVVWVDGIDTETGKPRPHQLGTYATQRAALAAARSQPLEERTGTRDRVSWFVRGDVAARTALPSLPARPPGRRAGRQYAACRASTLTPPRVGGAPCADAAPRP